MPFRQFLGRIRELISPHHSEHFAAISRDFENGALRQPAQPMSDRELADAMAEFVRVKPSDRSRDALNARFNPSK